jgi:hypothetical protein
MSCLIGSSTEAGPDDALNRERRIVPRGKDTRYASESGAEIFVMLLRPELIENLERSFSWILAYDAVSRCLPASYGTKVSC